MYTFPRTVHFNGPSWSTPIVSNGRLWGAIDCNNPIGAPDMGLLNWNTRQEAKSAFTLLLMFGHQNRPWTLSNVLEYPKCCYGPLAIPPLSLLCVTPKRPTESLSATHLPDRARFVRDVFVCETESPSRFLKGGLCRLWLAARAENTRILTCRSWFPSSLHCHLVTEYLYFGHKTVSAHNNAYLSVRHGKK